MYAIDDYLNYYFLEKNSKFISYLYYVENITDVEQYLNLVKSLNLDATHYCYAYIINDNYKYSDDNEPKNTAGKPIYEVLKKNKINFVLCIVVRYFGKVKLGSNNLIKCYSKACNDVLKITKKYKLIKGKNITITFDYKLEKEISKYVFNNLTKEYKEKITYTFNITIDNFNIIQTKYNIIDNKDIYLKI